MFDNYNTSSDGNEQEYDQKTAYRHLILLCIFSAVVISSLDPIASLLFPAPNDGGMGRFLQIIFVIQAQLILMVPATIIVYIIHGKLEGKKSAYKINRALRLLIPLIFNFLAVLSWWIIVPIFSSYYSTHYAHPATLQAIAAPQAKTTPKPTATLSADSKATATAQTIAMATVYAQFTAQPAATIKDESIIPNDDGNTPHQYQAVLRLYNLTPTASWRLDVKLVNYSESVTRKVGNEILYKGPFESPELTINIPIEKDRNSWVCQESFLTETLYLRYNLDGEAGPKESDDPSMQGYSYGTGNDLPVSSLVKQQIQKLVCEANP